MYYERNNPLSMINADVKEAIGFVTDSLLKKYGYKSMKEELLNGASYIDSMREYDLNYYGSIFRYEDLVNKICEKYNNSETQKIKL